MLSFDTRKISNFDASKSTSLMQKIKNFVLLPAMIMLAFSSCIKKEDYPVVPQIEFNDFIKVYDSAIYPSSGILSISFTDGDGDIGLSPRDIYPPYDTGSPYHYNFIIDYYEMQNGEFVKVEFPNFSFNSRIPVLNASNPGKAIKGIINEELPLNPFPEHDTIKFVVFIYDRALNQSNTVSTPPIILRRN